MTLEPQPQTHRFSTCHRHPGDHTTGFCASCLRERLSGLNTPIRREVSGGGGCNIASSSSSFPELRRCKSFSGGKNDGVSGVSSQPRRKSCDVRARKNTLWSLFNLDDERNGENPAIEVEKGKLGFSEVVSTVIETREEEEREIRFFEEPLVPDVNVIDNNNNRIREEEEEVEEEVKTMKEHIDLEWQSRTKPQTFAGSFWVAASVLSKKLHKWSRKQKARKKKHGGGGSLVAMEERENVNGRELRETQSEIADYGFGRRSCDTDPRFSVDTRRVSFDEPRASWDGYLIGNTMPRFTPTVSFCRSEDHLPIREKINSVNEEKRSPGGSSQTRDYYLDTSSRGRRSFDRSNSNRRAGVMEVDEMKAISNAKVSPTTLELFHGAKLLITEKDLRDLNSGSSLDSTSKDAASIAGGGGNRKGCKKFCKWQKRWTIWGLMNRRSERKYEDVVVDSSSVESLVKLRREADEEAKEAFGDKIVDSKKAGLFRSLKSSSAEVKGHGKKGRDPLVLERSRSARYSPNNLDNGLLRFYLTPLRSSRSICRKSRLKNSHSISRGVLRLY